jgi:putative transcriptional regulator
MDDDMLLAYAAGTLSEAPDVVVATHLSFCPACRARVMAAEAVGGALLDDVAPAPMAAGSVDAVLARLDAPVAEKPAKKPSASAADPQVFPHPLRAYMAGDLDKLRWSFVQPGVKFAELLVDESGARMGLMRTKPGAAITPHSHSGDELTLVLSGGYSACGLNYRRGDVQCADESVTHELVTDQDGECLSLVMIRGPIKPTRWIAKILRHLTDF